MLQSIASFASQMQLAKVQAEAGAKVAKMAMDSAKIQGDAMLEMIEMQKEIHAHLGSTVNTWA